MGAKNNTLMIVLITSEKPGTICYKNINAVLKVYFKLKPVIVDKWFKFQWPNQGAKVEYISELWILADLAYLLIKILAVPIGSSLCVWSSPIKRLEGQTRLG